MEREEEKIIFFNELFSLIDFELKHQLLDDGIPVRYSSLWKKFLIADSSVEEKFDPR